MLPPSTIFHTVSKSKSRFDRSCFFRHGCGALMLFAASAVADNATSGLALMERGQYADASRLIERAYANDSSSPALRLARAKLQRDPLCALAAYEKIAREHAAPVAVRAEALYRCAGIQYIRQNYAEAADYINQAAKFGHNAMMERLGEYAARQARSEDLQMPAALVPRDAIASQARSVFPAAGSFTLQTGSFGALENAKKRQQELSRDFNGVTVEEATVDGKTYYRVRIGVFASEAEAIAYAQSQCEPKGLAYRIVKR
jgi:tetratricopeptide (TPR) repeat protein